MKVLVTGATGFVGREVVRELHARGHSIRALVRSSTSPGTRTLIERYQVESAAGDIQQPDTLPRAMAGVDAVIHLVGIISEVGTQTFENVHQRGTENVVRATQKAGVKRFVQMSALGVRPAAVSRYHRSKWGAEEYVRASGLAHTIFRPGIIYGPDDHFVNLFATMARFSPVLPIMGNGQNLMQPIAVADVASGFVRSLETPEAIGRTFDLCGQERFTFEAILDEILRATGRKRLKLKIPMALARLQAALLKFVFGRLLRQAPPLNRDQLLMLEEDNVGDPEPARKLFGLELEPFRQGIERYLRVELTPRSRIP
jgi:NADH dehydrogenase